MNEFLVLHWYAPCSGIKTMPALLWHCLRLKTSNSCHFAVTQTTTVIRWVCTYQIRVSWQGSEAFSQEMPICFKSLMCFWPWKWISWIWKFSTCTTASLLQLNSEISSDHQTSVSSHVIVLYTIVPRIFPVWQLWCIEHMLMSCFVFRITTTAACMMDLRRYPLDEQNCTLEIESCK